jgi:hypothetical protein
MNQRFIYVFHRILPAYQAENEKALSDRQGFFAVVPGKTISGQVQVLALRERLECAQLNSTQLNSTQLNRLDADRFTLLRAFRPKIYRTGDLGEQGVILAHSNVFSRMYPGSSLANDDAPGRDEFPAVALHAQAFRI